MAAVSPLQSPAVTHLFSRRFSGTPGEPFFLAKVANPAEGFDPFRTPNGTEVLFLPNPAQLPHPLSFASASQWKNGLGLIVFRNAEANTVGAIFIHGAMRTPWSLIEPNAWQTMGGIMAFSGMSFEQAIETVVGKGYAMTPKWRFIDRSLTAAGHHTLTRLGGSKGILLHGPSVDDKRHAVAVTAELLQILGIYIGAADQNTGEDPETGINWQDEFGRLAPQTYMGSIHCAPEYVGMRTPSPYTARGVFGALLKIRDRLGLGRDASAFFQGAGGVGNVMIALAQERDLSVSGVSDALVQRLLKLRGQGLTAPLILDSQGTREQFGEERMLLEERAAREAGIPIVRGLIEALSTAHATQILSPNAGPHPITMPAAEHLVASAVQMVCGAANNMLGLVNGSTDPVAWYLQQHSIPIPNDSRVNRVGAKSLPVRAIGLDDAGVDRQIEQVAIDAEEEFANAFLRGVPPQIYSDQLAAADWNEAIAQGQAVGGYFDIRPIAAPTG